MLGCSISAQPAPAPRRYSTVGWWEGEWPAQPLQQLCSEACQR